jgi:hypothetical protein
MTLPRYKVQFPPLVISDLLESDCGCHSSSTTETIFEDKHNFCDVGTYTMYASIDPNLQPGIPQTFTFPNVPNIKMIWWEFSDQSQNTLSSVNMTLVDGSGAQTIRNLKNYFFCFCDSFQSLTLAVGNGLGSIKLKVILLG